MDGPTHRPNSKGRWATSGPRSCATCCASSSARISAPNPTHERDEHFLSDVQDRRFQVPIATIHVLEGRYDERRLCHVTRAVQDALISVWTIPSDDFLQVIHVLPRNRFLHSPSFLGMTYSDDLILLEVAFISGRPKESRLTLLKELNAQIVERAGISPDDLLIQLSEAPGENFSFGQGLAQRAYVSAGTVAAGDVPVTTASVNGEEHDEFERYRHQRRQR